MASSLKSFVTATPRQDEAAPLPPKNSIGKMPTGGKGPRPGSCVAAAREGRAVQVCLAVGRLGREAEEHGLGAIPLLAADHARDLEEMLRGKTTALALFKSEVEGAHPPAFHHM